MIRTYRQILDSEYHLVGLVSSCIIANARVESDLTWKRALACPE
jgi:hypothetical protein